MSGRVRHILLQRSDFSYGVNCTPQRGTRVPVGLPRLPAGRLTIGSLCLSFERSGEVSLTLTAG